MSGVQPELLGDSGKLSESAAAVGPTQAEAAGLGGGGSCCSQGLTPSHVIGTNPAGPRRGLTGRVGLRLCEILSHSV